MGPGNKDFELLDPDAIVSRCFAVKAVRHEPRTRVARARLAPLPASILSSEAPTIRYHAVFSNVGSQYLIEERRDDRHIESCWSDTGDMSLMPSGQPISWTIKGKSDVLGIYLSPEVTDEVADAIFKVRPQNVSLNRRLSISDKTMYDLGRLLKAETEYRDVGNTLVADMLGRALAAHLLRCYSNLIQQPL